jgi:anti-sigma factor RsiW
MNCSDIELRIDAYVDGRLDEASCGELETHLAACQACRDAVDDLRQVLAAAAALPRSIAPPRDLFPEIRSAVEARGSAGGRSRSGLPGTWLALAASLVLALTAGIVGISMIDRGGVKQPPVGKDSTVTLAANDAMAEFRAAEEEYLRATQQLIELLEARGGELPPETAAVLEENLETIDQAIEQVRLALVSDPHNARNGQVLTALHRQKLQLLRKASRLSS